MDCFYRQQFYELFPNLHGKYPLDSRVFHRVVNLAPSLLAEDAPLIPNHNFIDTQTQFYQLFPINMFTCGMFQCFVAPSQPVCKM